MGNNLPFISKEEFESSIEFRLFKRVITREYNWILNIESTDTEELNRWSSLYINLVIDIYKLQKLHNWKIESFVIYKVKEQLRNSESNYLEYFFSREDNSQDEITNFASELYHKFPEISEQIYDNIPFDLLTKPGDNKRPIRIDKYIVPNASILPIPNNIYIHNAKSK